MYQGINPNRKWCQSFAVLLLLGGAGCGGEPSADGDSYAAAVGGPPRAAVALALADPDRDARRVGDATPAEDGSELTATALKAKFGVIIPATNEYHSVSVPRAAEAHLGWVRFHAFWRWMEPKKGVFDFTAMDKYVADAVANKLGIYIGMGFFPPQWANGTEGQDCPVFSSSCASLPPKNPSDYTRFVTAVVNRYKDRVSYFAIWNEPDYKGFWNAPFSQYVDDILVPGAKAVKLAAPTAKVIGPEIFDSTSKLDTALAAACAHLDVIAVHLFRDTVDKNLNHLAGELPTIQARCPGKPVWVTAFGARSSELGEAGQATRLVDMFTRLNAVPQVKRIIFYTMVDQEGELKQGILGSPTEGYRKKPAYLAIQDYLARLP